MSVAGGATPLIAVDAVAVDTETTGLDASAARVVEIGALIITKGRLNSDRPFTSRVNPQMAIPASSSAIHGIRDADVSDAPAFAEAWGAFRAYAGDRLLIGYSIGFDLAVLEAECQRAGIVWQAPRTLCVRLLSAIANPTLPGHSIEMIASWLGVSVEGRHSALGDAAAAGAIFLRLVPHLQRRGIRTLAEAERACLGLTEQLESHHRAGWAEPVRRRSSDAGGRVIVDPYAYSHRVGEVMTAKPVVMPPQTSAMQAIVAMTESRISSLFVADPPVPGRPVGSYRIVTERDMMRQVGTGGPSALSNAIDGFAVGPLASIRAAAFVYRAIGRMDRMKIRHLAVRDDEGRLVGVVSARDLLRLRASAAISLDDRIENAADAAELASAWATLPSVAAALIGEKIDARTISEIVSEELRAMTRRAAILAETSMLQEGRGGPPCHYALMVLGSGGRGESLLAADQDNAIVHEDVAEDVDGWFAELGSRIASILDTAGIPFCKGGVMASNAQWRGSLSQWRDRVQAWVRHARPQDLLNTDIFFDLAAVHGDASLADALVAHSFEMASPAVAFAKLLGETATPKSLPLSLMGTIQTRDGRIDLKMHGLFPIVAAARTLAIRHDIRHRSTSLRLEALAEKGVASNGDVQALLRAHSLFLSVMLEQQSLDLEAGIPVSNLVEVGRLSRSRVRDLKNALRAVQTVPDLLRGAMFAR